MSQFKTVLLPLLLSAFVTSGLRAEDLAIQKLLRDYVDAFNKQDLDAVSSMWAENATHVDRETGERTEGRATIRADLAEVFKRPAKAHLAGTVTRVGFIKPDVATAEGTTTTSVPDEEPSVSQFSAILVSKGEKWEIESLEEMAVPQPATAAEALRELAWLEGMWLDNSKESPVVSTFRWSANRSFLIRSFSTRVGEDVEPLGTQVIGWDARSRQIRCWTFNSDGSFGDGVWSKAGDDWLIKSTQTLADGRAASGTYVITPVNGDSFTLRLIGHEVEGEPVPSSDPVSLTRLADVGQTAPDASKAKK